MQIIADLYMIGLSTSQLAIFQFNMSVNTLLLKNFIRWPSAVVIVKFAEKFLNLYRILYIVWAVDSSHIPTIAPRLYAADYYNRKIFHSVILQGVVSSKYFFWDFDIG